MLSCDMMTSKNIQKNIFFKIQANTPLKKILFYNRIFDVTRHQRAKESLQIKAFMG